MQNRLKGATLRVTKVALITALWLGVVPAMGQAQSYEPKRTADGKPDLNGIWQALNTANWDIQDHPARMGPVAALGAAFSVPGGQGVVEGNEIPYLPEALAKKKENSEKWLTSDPEIKCYLPGVPRATYMPHPFQIFQTPDYILIAYEFANANRTIYMNTKQKSSPIDTWMGWSVGHWEGNTLVVDVNSFNDQTWFDRAGNFHTDALHVVERYTPISPDALDYEVTIEDAKVFSRPWKMRMPLYRHLEKDARLVEYNCVEFAEELLYGHLRKQPSK
jgi:hypothetical protein